LPRAALFELVTERVVDPGVDGVTGTLGLKRTFIGPTNGPMIPFVTSCALRLTVPEKLLRLLASTTVDAERLTGTSLATPGTANRAKSGAGTVTVIVCGFEIVPEEPVTV
jgi:hypothetical protein